MEAGEGHHVHGELTEVAVKLAREAQGARGPADGRRHQVVQVTVGGSGKLKRSEADVVQRLVVEREALIGVFDQLVHGQRGVVRLDHGVRHLGRRDDRVRRHDAVGVLFADLGDEQGAHPCARASAHGVRQLEPLEGIAGFRLLPDDVQHRVDQLSPLGVVALGPVVARACLPEDEVVGPEELAERARTHGVHGSGLEVHEDGARHVATASGLVKVAVDALQLEVGVAMVRAGGVDSVLVRDDFPELRPDLLIPGTCCRRVTTIIIMSSHMSSHHHIVPEGELLSNRNTNST